MSIVKRLRQAGYYELAQEFENLEAENAALKADAKRYRWLRMRDMDIFNNENGEWLPGGGGMEEDLDAAIDKAKQ